MILIEFLSMVSGNDDQGIVQLFLFLKFVEDASHQWVGFRHAVVVEVQDCLLYTSDAADEL